MDPGEVIHSAEMAANSHRDKIDEIIRYLDSHNLAPVARSLERHSGLFFNLKYFEDCFINGNLDEAENYLSGFTSIDDNPYSVVVFLETRWHKFLQALHLKQRQRARRILREELRTFERYHHHLKDDAQKLLRLNDFRDGITDKYKDIGRARMRRMKKVKEDLKANPMLQNKIVYQTASFSDHVLALLPAGPLPAPPPESAKRCGVRRAREEEKEDHAQSSRHCTDLVPLSLQQDNLVLGVGATRVEVPKRRRGRSREEEIEDHAQSSRHCMDLVRFTLQGENLEVEATMAEAPKRRRGRPRAAEDEEEEDHAQNSRQSTLLDLASVYLQGENMEVEASQAIIVESPKRLRGRPSGQRKHPRMDTPTASSATPHLD